MEIGFISYISLSLNYANFCSIQSIMRLRLGHVGWAKCACSHLLYSSREVSRKIITRSSRSLLLEKTYTCMRFFCFVLIILYSLYLEYGSPLIPPASGLAG